MNCALIDTTQPDHDDTELSSPAPPPSSGHDQQATSPLDSSAGPSTGVLPLGGLFLLLSTSQAIHHHQISLPSMTLHRGGESNRGALLARPWLLILALHGNGPWQPMLPLFSSKNQINCRLISPSISNNFLKLSRFAMLDDAIRSSSFVVSPPSI